MAIHSLITEHMIDDYSLHKNCLSLKISASRPYPFVTDREEIGISTDGDTMLQQNATAFCSLPFHYIFNSYTQRVSAILNHDYLYKFEGRHHMCLRHNHKQSAQSLNSIVYNTTPSSNPEAQIFSRGISYTRTWF